MHFTQLRASNIRCYPLFGHRNLSKPINTFRDLKKKTERLSVAFTHFQCLTISAKLKAIQRQMKTSENNIKCISGAGLIYRDAKECYMFSSHVCFHAMKNPFIVQCRTCAFSKNLCRFYYRYLKRNTEKSDNINTNCPVAT